MKIGTNYKDAKEMNVYCVVYSADAHTEKD
jgi:hypothetical protein